MRRGLAALLLLIASPAMAGEMYGTITEGGKPVGEGAVGGGWGGLRVDRGSDGLVRVQ